jgi:hypothetical protein
MWDAEPLDHLGCGCACQLLSTRQRFQAGRNAMIRATESNLRRQISRARLWSDTAGTSKHVELVSLAEVPEHED